MDIAGKTVFVTGGSSGLGAATVRMIADAGGRAIVADVNDEGGNALAQELGDAAVFVRTDVTDESSVQEAIQKAVAQFGPLHGAVNCAGVGMAMRTTSKSGPHDLEAFKTVININLIGTFNVARLAAAAITANVPLETGERGVIVNTASIAAFDGQIGQVAYASSKAGIVGMTLAMARDLATMGIRVVTIAPGLFDTPLMAMLPQDQKDALADTIPFPKRLGAAVEFAHMVRQVLENPYLNGETIRLDGALRMPPR
ncbi:MAG: 3-hydroxyacyl-CoA dehydrogenase [Candidatus Hydrogenedentota bacterium]